MNGLDSRNGPKGCLPKRGEIQNIQLSARLARTSDSPILQYSEGLDPVREWFAFECGVEPR